jgi:hypothetical protein
MKKYCISLHGMGDSYIFLVEKEIWDWIHLTDLVASGRKDKESHWVDLQTPKSLKEKLEEELTVTIGSFGNDKALAATNIAVDDKVCYSTGEFLKWIKKTKYELADETYEGMIY